MMAVCVFAGSFDPFTVGHLQIARRAASLFGKTVILVAANAEKRCFFSDEERLEIVRASIADDPRLSVELCEETVADAAMSLGAVCIVKGLRDSTDYNYESHFAYACRALGGPEVVFLDVEEEYAHVSSTFVRELFRYEKDFSPYLAEGAHETVKRFLKNK